MSSRPVGLVRVTEGSGAWARTIVAAIVQLGVRSITARRKKMDQRYMVKRWLARIHTQSGRAFDVFSTGLSGWLLFCALSGTDPSGYGGCQSGLHVLVPRTDLRREIARAIPQR